VAKFQVLSWNVSGKLRKPVLIFESDYFPKTKFGREIRLLFLYGSQ